MTYVYLFESIHSPERHYVGVTDDLKQRFVDHNAGKSPHTRKFRPWNLVTYTAFADRAVAGDFEQYLKTGSGKAFIKRHYFPRR